MKRILLIDDEPVLRLTFEHILEEKGYEVEVATNGYEGVEICRALSPDLVITDLAMPEKDGITTIGELRDSYPNLPIIAISGHDVAADLMGKMEDLNVRFQAKPIDGDRLLSLVCDVIGEGESVENKG